MAIVIINRRGSILWCQRKGDDGWQFPQGGIDKNDIYTGGVKGNPNFGKEKISRVKKWIKEKKIDLNINIFAYSDSIYDLDLLNFSDNPTAINPDNKLRKICNERNWEIIERFNY